MLFRNIETYYLLQFYCNENCLAENKSLAVQQRNIFLPTGNNLMIRKYEEEEARKTKFFKSF